MMHTIDPDPQQQFRVSKGPDAHFPGQWEETSEAELPLENQAQTILLPCILKNLSITVLALLQQNLLYTHWKSAAIYMIVNSKLCFLRFRTL